MQNCLHSRCARKNLRIVLVCLLPCVAVLGVILALHLYSAPSQRIKYVASEPFVKVYEGGATENVVQEKMNNEPLQVAKNEEKDVSDVICDIPAKRNVRVLVKDGRVVEMELEDYVTGCVFGEMPLSFESQAIMAQSVAVRTFTIRCMMGKSKHKNADVCTNPACCQNFSDIDGKTVSSESRDKLFDCVGATRGIVMMYEGEPINAVYHASSGDKTLSSEQVWGGRLDYLVSVDAPEGEKEIYKNGYGHRVGMSQHGANLLAIDGKDYAEILKYYYSGIYFSFV